MKIQPDAVKGIIDRVYDWTLALLRENRDELEHCARQLLEKETLTEADLRPVRERLRRPQQTEAGAGVVAS